MSENLNVPSNVTQDDIDKALKMLSNQKAQRLRQADRRKNDPEFQAKQKANSLKRRISQKLLVEKAVAAGITVSDKEVDAAIAEAENAS